MFLTFFFVDRYMEMKKDAKWVSPYISENTNGRLWYCTYIHSIGHALVSTCGALYCIVYANGKASTTWFHSDEYANQMYDIQKYLAMMSCGYFVCDLLNYIILGGLSGNV